MSNRRDILQRWHLCLMAIAAGGLAAGLWSVGAARADDPAPAVSAPTVPVTTVSATRRDVPAYLTGLGSVQALNSVLVRARVDGTLDSVNVVEGQDVKTGDLLAVIDPRPYQAALDQALAKKAQDVATLENAKLDLGRYASLARSQFASQQSVDTQKSTVGTLTAQIEGDTAAIEVAQLNLSFTHIKSPLDGRVGLRLVDPGNLIHASDVTGLITITQIHPISVVFTLPEEQLPRIAAAMRTGKLPVIAYGSDNKTKLATGELLTPDNMIDTTTGTIKLKATFPNTEGNLWPGQFIDVRLQVEVLPQAVTVPAATVQRGQDSLFVFVINPDQTARLQPVQEAFEQDGIAVITKGLNGGETVVINGQSRLNNGTKVVAKSDAGTATGS
jgi:multidrug efflux system membrane fusion protein